MTRSRVTTAILALACIALGMLFGPQPRRSDAAALRAELAQCKGLAIVQAAFVAGATDQSRRVLDLFMPGGDSTRNEVRNLIAAQEAVE